ncbi:hypothetical protein HK096_010515 [Nowakowskiella sp. JEL0078]|nr:hypothetical protein HK096_010515 [Nowakowskiella sp. JEL0078]
MILDTDDSIVTDLVQHPIPIQPIAEPGAPPPKAVMLTEKERKKLRRQLRAERLKDKQEKIRLGLMPPEEAKVKISNLMRVLGGDAIQDPTKVEAKVRAQMAARLSAHKKHNESRKLTPKQRREKNIRKLNEDTSQIVEVAVFRVDDLSNALNRKKIELNAQQYYLTGVALWYSSMNLITVEGGPRGIKKFKRLMLHRINWENADQAEEDFVDEAETEHSNKGCLLMIKCLTEDEVKQMLTKHGALHYWDAARNFVSEFRIT